jgi:hypothetical protein
MPDTCPRCGVELPPVRDAFCSACGNELPATPRVGKPEIDNLGAVSHSPSRPRFPGWLVLFLTPIICGWFRTLVFLNGAFSTTSLTGGTIIGALVALVLALVIWFDDRTVQRRWQDRVPGTVEGLEAEETPPKPQPPSEAVAVVMLVIPLVAGALVWQQGLLHLSGRSVALLSAGTVVSTAVLGYLDLRRLNLGFPADPAKPRPETSAVGTFVATLFLWLVGYPIHFIARRRVGGKNLIIPALVVTGVFLAPTVKALFGGQTLPFVDSPEVISLVTKVIEDGAVYRARKDELGPLTVREPVEVSFDEQGQKRVGRAKVITKLGEETIFYTVEWQDRTKVLFRVNVYDRQP